MAGVAPPPVKWGWSEDGKNMRRRDLWCCTSLKKGVTGRPFGILHPAMGGWKA